ncbi:2-acylglycerol O-acyltransferase 1-like [Clavelina lepadiformis]|uniref:2-acylglycerol O-acyltransferase 1-like n=1 Tax=Clavelina lepadiformis TaxID=159417 RepID=UPI0040420411
MLEFAPFRIPMDRRMQTFAVSHFVFCFLFLGPLSVIFFIYVMFFTSYWYLLIPYIIFYVLDWDTPEKGGRRSPWIRNWKFWKHMSNYFPTSLYKTVDLDPCKNYIFGIHPHGVLCMGSFTHFCTNGSEFESIFPGFNSHLTMLPFWFRLPFHRDYLMTGGLVPSTKRSILHILSRPDGGNICCIIPGGAPESLNARPGDCVIMLKNRFGFIKVALTEGVDLVPVFSFGDHELWEQEPNPPGSWLRKFQDFSQKWCTFALPMFHARGIFQYNYGLMPYRKPIHTVVGEPIEVEKNANPTKEEIQALHDKYVTKLQELYDKHKSKYVKGESKLVIE